MIAVNLLEPQYRISLSLWYPIRTFTIFGFHLISFRARSSFFGIMLVFRFSMSKQLATL